MTVFLDAIDAANGERLAGIRLGLRDGKRFNHLSLPLVDGQVHGPANVV